ncbi:PKD domain-containing protein [Geodermatophilus sp. CPCC 205506]|uniref:PKD domain-containing protein n=1 Tax=Geodermatophilus sp. CPCC 205506 TaxID=2936596 RepID=UPI003EEDB912
MSAAPKRLVSGVLSTLLMAGGLAFLAPGTALADSAPATPSAANPATVTADPLPTVQIDGVVWSQVVVGNTVYAAGSFTRARPAGAPAGTSETVRNNLLAYDIRTGELVQSFAPDLNAQALVVAASPDGSRIYVGGDFTRANGQVRNRIAAYDTRTHALVATWAPSANGQVRALAATASTVYFGGSLTAVGAVSRTRLAAVRASDGGLLPWVPVPGVGPTSGNRLPFFDAKGNAIPNTSDAARNAITSNEVMALVVAGGGSQVVVAGRFYAMNGVKATGVTALDPGSGATRPFAANQLITNHGNNSAVWSLSTDGDAVYGTGYDFYGPGNLEGSFAADAVGGRLRWVADCRGDTYSGFPTGGALYLASHAHSCVNIGGFPEQEPRVWKRATALSLSPAASVGIVAQSNLNFTGQPAPAVLTWYPSFAQGEYTRQFQGGWSVSGNDRYVVYGGEFPRVNGQAQQGLVRFAMPELAPNAVGPTAGSPTAATAIAPGAVRVSFQAASDDDNGTLTYSVFRDGATTPVARFSRPSSWWQRPVLAWTDRAVAEGAHSYRVVSADPYGNEVDLGTATVAVSGTGSARAYADAVHADGATEYWPLGERSGAIAYSQAGANDSTMTPGVQLNWPGGLQGDADTAAWFDGTSGSLGSQTAVRGPDTFSVEAWFETRTTAGGVIMDFGSARTGLSSDNDRQIWLDPAGRVNFAVYPDAPRILTSPAVYNNGTWHHVVGTVGPDGMSLYVDGRLVASRADTTGAYDITGFWRIGADRPWASTPYYNGRLDEVAVYPAALTAEQVARHHALGSTGTAPNAAPSAAFLASVSDAEASFDASGSSDSDGAIASYAWDFGDGSTGTGPTVAHQYRATATYTVTLRVTDARGATATTTRPVAIVVPPPNQPPTAAFTATTTGLVARVDGSASADADGTVTARAWDFGDGTSGTGATASHAYSAAGTYTVRLTVTDDDGATATTTRDVTVAPTAGPAVLAQDGFGRSVSNGLGVAEVGGAWSASVGGTRLSVSPGAAEFALPAAGNNTAAFLGEVAQTSADVRTAFALSAAPTGAGTYVYVSGRRVSATLEYRVRVRVMADGRVGLALSRLAGGETFPGGEVVVPGLSWTPGTVLNVRVLVAGVGGTEVTGAVWAQGTPEPAPQLVRTDSTAALQAPGGVGLAVHRPGGTTTATTVRFSPVAVTAVGAGGGAEQPPAEEPPVEQPPANVAPTAALTAAVSGLGVAVDGSASADADGTVTAHAWDFGDGSTGSGATATHTYSAAGTYTVRLTVTDDDAATGTAERQVTVTAPPVQEPPAEEPPAGPAVLARDGFGRSVSNGLGVAEVGGAWSASVGGTRLSVSPGAAEFALPAAGNNTAAFLGEVAQTSADVRTAFALSAAPTGAGTYVYVSGRRVSATLEYRVRVRVMADGRVGLALSRLAGGETFPGGEVVVPGLSWTPGTVLNVRVLVAGVGGTEVTGAVWAQGTPEPAPQLVRTDSTAALQAPGGVGLAVHRPGGTTTATTVRFTTLAVTAAE